MIYKTAYETTACKGYVLNRTVDALRAAKIVGALRTLEAGNVAQLEDNGNPHSGEVPAFAHPIIFADSNKVEQVAFDARSFGRWDQGSYEFRITNQAEYALMLVRSELTAIWAFDRIEPLRDFSLLPMSVYAALVSEAVGRRFALDPREQYMVAICAGIFYAGLFMQDSTPDEREKTRLAGVVSRAVRASAEDVFTVLDEHETIPQTIAEFCTYVTKVTQSVRLEALNAGLLFSIVGGTWFGTNAKETIAVALEHPPTWISILSAALSERGYRNSTVAKTAERFAGRNASDFLRAALKIRRPV